MKKFLSLLLIFVGVTAYSQSQQICAGSSATLHATPPVNSSTLVTPSASFVTSTGSFIVSPTVTTNYTLITSTSTTSIPMTVTVNPKPLVNLTYTNPSCTSSLSAFNFNLTFNPSSPLPTYTVLWAPDPALTSTIPVVPNCVTSPTDYSCAGYISPANYQASVVAAGGCLVVVHFTILNQPAPALFTLSPTGTSFSSATVYSVTCSTPTINLTTNNTGLTYTWTAGTLGTYLSPSIAITSTNQGSMTVCGTNTVSTCTTCKPLSIIVNTAVPVGVFSPSNMAINCTSTVIPQVTLTCSSPTVNFTHAIVTPAGGNWNSNLVTAIYQVGQPGTYTYALINTANGCSLTRNFTVTSTNTYPTYQMTSPENFTLGCSTKSIATISFGNPQAGTPGAPLTYTFIPPGGNPNLTGPFANASTKTVTAAGQWTVICHEQGSNCQTQTQVSMLLNTAPPTLDTVLISRGGILTCDSTSVKLEASSETPNIGYNWAYGSPIQQLSTFSVAAVSTLALPSQTVAYVYTLTLKDNGNFCTTSSTYTVYHNVAPPIASITPQNQGVNFVTCTNSLVVLTNQSKTTIKPYFNPTKPVSGFYWEGPTPQIPLSISSSYSAAVVGIYTLTARDPNNGCKSTGTIQVLDGRDFPVFTPNGNIIDCGSNSSTIGVAAPNPSVNYSWKLPTPFHSTGLLNTYTCQASLPGTFTLTVTDKVSGCVVSKTVNADPAKLIGSFAFSDTSGFAPLQVNVVNNSFSGLNSTSSISTVWSFGNGTSSVTPTTSNSAGALYTLPGTYTVKIWVNKTPCKDSATKIIRVDIPSTLDVPNVFTPNGDGINDFYFLKTNSLSKISMTIFDRWGRMIFEVLESTSGNISWDGKNASGKDVPDGTYFYFLNATGKDTKDYSRKGTITLTR